MSASSVRSALRSSLYSGSRRCFSKKRRRTSCNNLPASIACKIERGFAARLEPQNALRKEAIRAVAVNAETARAVHEVWAELLFQQIEQMRIGDLAVVWTKLETAALALNLDPSQRGVADEADRCARA